MDTDSENQTWLSTVVFTDIVGYSKRSVDQQIEIKEHFNQLISEAIADVDPEDRVVLDTGDGVALCMLGDPEAAIKATMELRNRVLTPQMSAPIPYEIRTGVNLGPVRLVTDINKQYNVLGDGINTAQRIMSFAGSNQMLVSRSFYDVAWCLSDEYSNLFQYLGVRKDKHERQHVLYEVRHHTDTVEIDIEFEPTSEPVFDEVTRIIRSRLANEAAPAISIDWDDEILRRVENDLVQHIGPLASLLVRKEANHAPSLEDLFVRLARAVPAGKARSAFMARTAEILDEVNTAEPVSVPSELTRTELSDTVSKPVSHSKPAAWDPAILDLATKQLAAFIGPLAAMLVRKASRRTGSVTELYALLANEVPDPRDRDTFLKGAPKA
jgi:class 3 adenylate cyclase